MGCKVFAALGDNPPAPPGYNPKTWNHDQWLRNSGEKIDVLTDPEGNKWIAHPEDEGHWRHWDKQGPGGDDQGRSPPNSLKPWEGQKRPPYGNQSATDPNGDAPPFEPPEADFAEHCTKRYGDRPNNSGSGYRGSWHQSSATRTHTGSSTMTLSRHQLIQQRRKEIGLSASEIARLIGISNSRYQDVELHDDEVVDVLPLRNTRRLAEVLGISLDELLGIAGRAGVVEDQLAIIRNRRALAKDARRRLGVSPTKMANDIGFEKAFVHNLEKNWGAARKLSVPSAGDCGQLSKYPSSGISQGILRVKGAQLPPYGATPSVADNTKSIRGPSSRTDAETARQEE